MHDATIERAAGALREADRIAALTGAGMSAESGIPTFRGAGGLWRQFRPEELATPEAFARDPSVVWDWYRWRRRLIAQAEPNDGHRVLARFETRFPEFTLVTQNVDGLHRRAGSAAIIELHGNIWRARCTVERRRVVDQAGDPPAPEASDPPRCACGALLRPDVVWFGEMLDPVDVARATAALRRCAVLLVVGTSALVFPAAGFPLIAAEAGALVVEINTEETALTARADVVLRGPAAGVLPALERAL